MERFSLNDEYKYQDKINQVTNGPVKAHLTSEQILSTKPGDK